MKMERVKKTWLLNFGAVAPNIRIVNSIFPTLRNLLLWMMNTKFFSGCLNVPASWHFQCMPKNFVSMPCRIMWHGKSLGKPRLFSFGAPQAKAAAWISIIPHFQHFCQGKSDRQFAQNFSQNLVQLFYKKDLYFWGKWVIINSVKGARQLATTKKVVEKQNFLLTNFKNYYIIYLEIRKEQKINKKNSLKKEKKCLTSKSKCVIMIM